MNVTCAGCQSVFRVNPAKVPPGGVRARCSACGAVIQVTGAPSSTGSAGAASAHIRGALPTTGRMRVPQAVMDSDAASAPEHYELEPTIEHRMEPGIAPTIAPTIAPMVAPTLAWATDWAPDWTTDRATPTVASPADSARGAALRPPGVPALPPIAPWRPPRAPVGPRVPSGDALPPPRMVAPPVRPAAPLRPAAPVTPPRPPVLGTPGQPVGGPVLRDDPHLKARRLARALVSDMVADCPDQHEQGLRDGTLPTLFKEEIARSYEAYCAQVGREFAGATTHFQDALNDVLARGQRVF